MVEKNFGKSKTDVRLLLDRCSIETFLNSGTYNQTIHHRPGQHQQQITMATKGKGVVIKNLKLYQLKSIWPKAGVKEIQPLMSRTGARQYMDNLKKYK